MAPAAEADAEAPSFWSMSRSALAEAFADGYPIDPIALDDTEYKGVSLGLPGFVERLTWKKFKKVFHRDPGTGFLRGWNVRLEQNALDGPCIPKLKNGEPICFGHYRAVSARGRRMPFVAEQALLLDYGLGANPSWDPTRWVRDPLVALQRGDARLLLGRMYLEIGWLCLRTPSFFTLELDGPLVLSDPRQRGR